MRISMIARTCAVALCLFSLVACSGGESSNYHGPNREALEAERQARREADLQRERALTELARLQRRQREAEKKRWDEIEARRKAEAAQRRKDGTGQVCGKNPDNSVWCEGAEEYAARLAKEREEWLRTTTDPRRMGGQVKTFLPWPNHSMPLPTDLGPWTDPDYGLSMVVSDHVVFGVRNEWGTLTPWIHGGIPETSLYANDEVRRTYDEYGYYTTDFSKVRWTGSLIGYTPDRQVVTGKAELGDFDFSGRNYQSGAWDPGKSRLTFSELQYRDTQATWGDGDLLYWVKLGRTFAGGNPVNDSSFSYPYRDFNCTRHAAGCYDDALSVGPGGTHWGPDAGVVRGMLLGPKHEAMAGTLQRNDLTAAFGGRR